MAVLHEESERVRVRRRWNAPTTAMVAEKNPTTRFALSKNPPPEPLPLIPASPNACPRQG